MKEAAALPDANHRAIKKTITGKADADNMAIL